MSAARRGKWDSDSDEESKQKGADGSKQQKKHRKDPQPSRQTQPAASTVAPIASVQHSNPSAPIASAPAVSSSSSSSSSVFGNRLKPPCRSVECYDRLNFIDQGTYGMVFRARCRETGVVYALKQVKLSAEAARTGFPITAFREINILLTLRHPNILQVREMVVGGTIDKIYMVMEYYENDLKAVMKMNRQSFSTAEVKRLMVQLLDALDYMHGRWFVHRDLKSSNLLYSNKGQLCVCDFGLARKYESSPAQPYTQEVVTLWYRAPELLLGITAYGPAIDLWSAGCIMAEMVSGEALLPGQGPLDQLQRIFSLLGTPNDSVWPDYRTLVLPENQRKLSWKLPNRSRLRDVFPVAALAADLALSDTGVHLLSQLLHMDPKQRCTAAQGLRHSWLTEELPGPRAEHLMPVFLPSNEQHAN